MPDVPTAALWVIVGLAAIWDLAQRRIPNQLVLAGLLLGLAMSAWSGGLAGLGRSLLGAGVALALLVGPFAARWLGGGDVKLAMVVGAFLAWQGAVQVVLLGTAIHGLVALGMLAARRAGVPALPGVPHAVGFAVATALYTLGLVRFF